MSRSPLLNLALFLATVATTLVAGASHLALQLPAVQGGPFARGLAEAWAVALAGLPFSAALLGILSCHELGHYLVARAHRVDSTLPFFVPMPFGPVGTFGAVIRIRSAIPSRRAILDIGAAGPFAGFLVALPLLAWGMAHSEVRPMGDAALETAGSGAISVARGLLAAVLHGEPYGSGYEHYGASAVIWVTQRLVLGKLPPGTDVFLHPVAYAAWIGLLVTTLNLMPLGQLDGGHVIYALLGRRRAHAFSRAASLGLLLAGLFACWSWLIWWAVTLFVVRLDHPPARDEQPLDPGRAALAVLALVLFAVTFTPVPLSL